MSDLFDLPFEDDEPAETEAGLPAQPVATRRVYTVTELTVRVRDHLEDQFFEVWVEGEISNCRLWNTGHLYFTLKDSSSQLKGLMSRPGHSCRMPGGSPRSCPAEGFAPAASRRPLRHDPSRQPGRRSRAPVQSPGRPALKSVIDSSSS